MLELFPTGSEDVLNQPLEEVMGWLQGYPARAHDGLDLEATFSRSIRQAIDEVIDGSRTGSYRYEELETQEKAYIGTRIEIVVRTELELEREGKLDTVSPATRWTSSGRPGAAG